MFSSQKKASAVLLGIIHKAGDKWHGKTTLAKAFWWAHLVSLKERGAELSEHSIVHLPNGPAPNDLDILLAGLTSMKLLTQEESSDGPYPKIVFCVTPDGNRFIEETLTKQELTCAEKAAAKFSGMTATKASSWAHANSPEWNRTVDGDTMNIGRDLLEEEAFESAGKAASEAEAELRKLFGPRED